MDMAAVALAPGNILAWLVVGLIAGAVAGWLTRGHSFGCVGNIVVGLVGAFVGGLIVTPLVHGDKAYGFWSTTGVAIIGAIILILVLSLIRRAL